jgi:hypothetical protein
MNKPSRRAVVRTGVWAVPVVATAAAAPSFAGTTTPPVSILSAGYACKVGGDSGTSDPKQYNMVVTFHNNTASAQNVTITNLVITGATVTGITFPVTYNNLPPGDTSVLLTLDSSDSSQRNAIISYSVDGQMEPPAPVTFSGFNPCNCKNNPDSLADCAPNTHPHS